MSRRGVFKSGVFASCLEVLPQCIGRAVNGRLQCTCGDYSAADIVTAQAGGWTADSRMDFDQLKRWGHKLTGGVP